VSGGRGGRAWSVDEGAIQVATASPAKTPTLSAHQAACNLMAGLTPQNYPLSYVLPTGSTLGYGRLTVSPKLAHAYLYVGQSDQTSPTPPVYRDRPAWILTVSYSPPYSCPAMVPATPSPAPSPTRSVPRSWSYLVLAVDAMTGRDAITYVEAAPAGCGGGGQEDPATSTIPYQNVSVPWRNEWMSKDRVLGQIDTFYAGCETVPQQGAWVNRERPEVEVVAVRAIGKTCGPRQWHTLQLHPATVTQTIPTKLAHAPIGPIDRVAG